MLQDYQKKYNLDYSIGQLTPTICSLFNIRNPKECQADPITQVVTHAKHLFSSGKVDKVLIYNPDAIGHDLYIRYPEKLKPVDDSTDFRFCSAAVMDSVTPVCFATIYSGAAPEIHGIQTYRKPVLEVETLFDVLAEAGLNVAILAVNTCSIDTIFRKRNIDYYSFRSDSGTHNMTKHLLEYFDYDVIISYYYSFDNSSHNCGGPYTEKSLNFLDEAVDFYMDLNATIDRYWAKYNRAIVFAPDHGMHLVDNNRGNHGEDIAEDMIVNHFYRLRSGEC